MCSNLMPMYIWYGKKIWSYGSLMPLFSSLGTLKHLMFIISLPIPSCQRFFYFLYQYLCLPWRCMPSWFHISLFGYQISCKYWFTSQDFWQDTLPTSTLSCWAYRFLLHVSQGWVCHIPWWSSYDTTSFLCYYIEPWLPSCHMEVSCGWWYH